MENWASLLALSRLQRGCVSIWQALDLGVPERTLHDRTSGEGWRRPYESVFVSPVVPITYEVEVTAAFLAVGGRPDLAREPGNRPDPVIAVAAGAAAHLQGLLSEPSYPIVLGTQLRLGTNHRPRAAASPFHRQGLQVRRLQAITADQMLWRPDFAITEPIRTPVDLARDVSDYVLGRAIVNALRLRHFALADFQQFIEQLGRFWGKARVQRTLAALAGEISHSRDEAFARRLLLDAGYRPHPRPYPLIKGDRILAEIDIPFVEVRYGVEVDGMFHLLPEQAAADKARDRLVKREFDWDTDRYTTEQVHSDPRRFLREVGQALAQRGVYPEQRAS